MTDIHSNDILRAGSAPATMATVKHGGCVQLGDGLQLANEWGHVFAGDGHDMAGANKNTIRRFIQAIDALSAQPSPVDMVNPISPATAGQGDAVEHTKNLDLLRAGTPLVASRVAALLGSKQTSIPSGIKPFHCEINVSPVVPPEITPPGCVWGTLTTCFKRNAESLCCMNCYSDPFRDAKVDGLRPLAQVEFSLREHTQGLTAAGKLSGIVRLGHKPLLRGLGFRPFQAKWVIARYRFSACPCLSDISTEGQSEQRVSTPSLSDSRDGRCSQGSQNASRRCHRRGRVPVENARGANPVALTDPIPPAHSLIPLWIGRHSAMPMRRVEITHG